MRYLTISVFADFFRSWQDFSWTLSGMAYVLSTSPLWTNRKEQLRCIDLFNCCTRTGPQSVIIFYSVRFYARQRLGWHLWRNWLCRRLEKVLRMRKENTFLDKQLNVISSKGPLFYVYKCFQIWRWRYTRTTWKVCDLYFIICLQMFPTFILKPVQGLIKKFLT